MGINDLNANITGTKAAENLPESRPQISAATVQMVDADTQTLSVRERAALIGVLAGKIQSKGSTRHDKTSSHTPEKPGKRRKGNRRCRKRSNHNGSADYRKPLTAITNTK